MSEIEINDLKKIINNVNLIDVRDNYQYIMGHIPNSINIPMNFLIKNPDNYLDKNNVYYIYCEMGHKSKKTCLLLSSNGYNVVNVLGGYNAYKLSFHDLTK